MAIKTFEALASNNLNSKQELALWHIARIAYDIKNYDKLKLIYQRHL